MSVTVFVTVSVTAFVALSVMSVTTYLGHGSGTQLLLPPGQSPTEHGTAEDGFITSVCVCYICVCDVYVSLCACVCLETVRCMCNSIIDDKNKYHNHNIPNVLTGFSPVCV